MGNEQARGGRVAPAADKPNPTRRHAAAADRARAEGELNAQMEALATRFAAERAALEADAAADRDTAAAQKAAVEASYAARVAELEGLSTDMERIRATLAAALLKPTADGAVPDLQAVLTALSSVSAGENAALQRAMRLQAEDNLQTALAEPLGGPPPAKPQAAAPASATQGKQRPKGVFGLLTRILGLGR